jgi:hypothetical protein
VKHDQDPPSFRLPWLVQKFFVFSRVILRRFEENYSDVVRRVRIFKVNLNTAINLKFEIAFKYDE